MIIASRLPRSASATHPERGFVEEIFAALIRTRDAARAQSVVPVKNRTGAAQDIRGSFAVVREGPSITVSMISRQTDRSRPAMDGTSPYCPIKPGIACDLDRLHSLQRGIKMPTTLAQGWRDSSHTAMVGAGKFGSAK